MSKENEISENDIRLVFGGKTAEQEELEGIEKSFESFVEKYGGQYFCLVIWPEDAETEKREKYKVGMSNRVRILPSKQRVPFDRALIEIFNWMRMEQQRRQPKEQKEV
jgi:hypothetical protein